MKPQIIMGYGAVNPGYDFGEKLSHIALHRDLSCITIVPTRGMIAAHVVDSWLSITQAPNQKYARLMAVGMEVGSAYNALIEFILSNEELSTWKYVMTLEEDNLPPPMGLVKLLQAIEDNEYDVLGGLYFVKGSCGFPQIWGDPDDPKENYRPLVPRTPETHGDDLIVPCNGTGMGFTLYRLDLFRKISQPWFTTTIDDHGPWTQDLHFFHKARLEGHELKVGVHCGVKVGHLDVSSGILW